MRSLCELKIKNMAQIGEVWVIAFGTGVASLIPSNGPGQTPHAKKTKQKPSCKMAQLRLQLVRTSDTNISLHVVLCTLYVTNKGCCYWHPGVPEGSQ